MTGMNFSYTLIAFMVVLTWWKLRQYEGLEISLKCCMKPYVHFEINKRMTADSCYQTSNIFSPY